MKSANALLWRVLCQIIPIEYLLDLWSSTENVSPMYNFCKDFAFSKISEKDTANENKRAVTWQVLKFFLSVSESYFSQMRVICL